MVVTFFCQEKPQTRSIDGNFHARSTTTTHQSYSAATPKRCWYGRANTCRRSDKLIHQARGRVARLFRRKAANDVWKIVQIRVARCCKGGSESWPKMPGLRPIGYTHALSETHSPAASGVDPYGTGGRVPQYLLWGDMPMNVPQYLGVFVLEQWWVGLIEKVIVIN